MNREEEKFAFNKFLRAFGKLPDGEKTESPDFIIPTEKGRIGVELTELIFEKINGISIAEIYSIEDSIVKLVQFDFDKKSKKKIWATISFQDNIKISGKDKILLAQEISLFIINSLENYLDEHLENLEILENLPKGVRGIYFDIVPFFTESLISPMRGKWPPPIDFETLNEVILKKNRNLLRYKAKVDFVYLVILVSLSFKSHHGDFVNAGSLISNDFDKIFLFNTLSDKVFEIK
jgi:hypothetical protein